MFCLSPDTINPVGVYDGEAAVRERKTTFFSRAIL